MLADVGGVGRHDEAAGFDPNRQRGARWKDFKLERRLPTEGLRIVALGGAHFRDEMPHAAQGQARATQPEPAAAMREVLGSQVVPYCQERRDVTLDGSELFSRFETLARDDRLEVRGQAGGKEPVPGPASSGILVRRFGIFVDGCENLRAIIEQDGCWNNGCFESFIAKSIAMRQAGEATVQPQKAVTATQG